MKNNILIADLYEADNGKIKKKNKLGINLFLLLYIYINIYMYVYYKKGYIWVVEV